MAIILDEGVTITNGNMVRVVNQNKKTNANTKYWFTYIQLPDGEEIPVMLTENELERIRNRALKNTEDTPNKNWVVDILD